MGIAPLTGSENRDGAGGLDGVASALLANVGGRTLAGTNVYRGKCISYSVGYL